jgi:hypothetical protein
VYGVRPPQIDSAGLVGWVASNVVDIFGGRDTARAEQVWNGVEMQQHV